MKKLDNMVSVFQLMHFCNVKLWVCGWHRFRITTNDCSTCNVSEALPSLHYILSVFQSWFQCDVNSIIMVLTVRQGTYNASAPKIILAWTLVCFHKASNSWITLIQVNRNVLKHWWYVVHAMVHLCLGTMYCTYNQFNQ